jgi:hypothetical protein
LVAGKTVRQLPGFFYYRTRFEIFHHRLLVDANCLTVWLPGKTVRQLTIFFIIEQDLKFFITVY